MNQPARQDIRLIALEDQNSYIGQFQAMGADCQLLMSDCNLREANQCLNAVSTEAWRIQNKYSRFSSESVTAQINYSHGEPVQVDAETTHLLDMLDQLYQLSGGRFDATAGCLREIWNFAPGSQLPSERQVELVRQRIDWKRVNRGKHDISLPKEIRLDFDAVARSYAVDSCLKLASLEVSSSLVNLGGDVAASAPPAEGDPWKVAISGIGQGFDQTRHITLDQGGVATRGDAKRYIKSAGIKYGHVLDSRSGWPLKDAPASVTAVGRSCEEASLYSTIALYNPRQADQFLKDNDIQYWIQSAD